MASCTSENWPSTDQIWREYYLENEYAFDRMVDRLKASPYAIMKRKNALEMAYASQLENKATQGSEMIAKRTYGSDYEPVVDEDQWRELFEETGFHSIRLDGGLFFADLTVATERLIAGEFADEVSPLYIRGLPVEKHACEAWHRKLKCGKCYQLINDAWGVQYAWANYERREVEYFNPENPVEDQLAANNQIGQECVRKGYEAIGYETEEDKE